MTPFGQRMRKLRSERGITLKRMANDLGVSPAYLSALEHGKRGRPGWHLVQRINAFFNIIWDDAEDVVRLARLSHPRISIETGGLDPKATEFANRLAEVIDKLDDKALDDLLSTLEQRGPRSKI